MTKGRWTLSALPRSARGILAVAGALTPSLGCSIESTSEGVVLEKRLAVTPMAESEAVPISVQEQTRVVSCGLNGRGEQDQVLALDEWVDEGVCDDPDECVDGKVAKKVACADGKGTGNRVCEAGAWVTKKCKCSDAGETYDDLADACLVPIACDRKAEPFGGGDGADAPFLICSETQLQSVPTAPNARFLLAKSLDLSCLEDFVPLGILGGEFDGGGRALVGLAIDRGTAALGTAENNVGLFRQLGEESTVRNLKLVDFTVLGQSAVGVLAGTASYENLIENVHVAGGTVTGAAGVGGLIGRLDWGHSVLDSTSSATVVGQQGGVGGLAGTAYHGTIQRSSAHGDVSATGNSVGGLVGDSTEVGMFRVAATGNVAALVNVGGLVGRSGDNGIVESFASGDVHGGTSVGGLVGWERSYDGQLENSYALGNVTAEGLYVGGLVGSALGIFYAPFVDNYSFGRVFWTGTGEAPASIGAGVGINAMIFIRTMARAQLPPLPLVGESSTDYDSDGGITIDSEVLSVAEFADQASFPGWNFDDVWIMSPTLGRPILRWQLED